MVENTNVAPPLDLDLGSVDTSLPLLAAGLYEMQIAEVNPVNSAANLPMLKLRLNTLAQATSADGQPLGPGIPVFENLNMAPSGKATWDMIKRNVAQIVQSAGISTSWGEFQNNAVALLQGQTVRVTIGVEPAGVNPKNGKKYNAKNVVETWHKKGAQ